MRALIAALLLAWPAAAEPIRIATFAAPLSRDGPGLLLADLLGGDDPQVAAVRAIVDEVGPDLLLLTEFDYDAEGIALSAFAEGLADPLPHLFSARPNSGLASGLDLDGNGRTGEPRDAQGYGRFAGDGGLALLSRWPVTLTQDFTGLLWRDLPGATLPKGSFPSAEAQAAQRLSSTAHWVLTVEHPAGPFHLLAWSATPPVYDGPEDLNGLRNRDELRVWLHWQHGAFGPLPDLPSVLLGKSNLDPADGEGFPDAMRELLESSIWQDPEPRSVGGRLAADPAHAGDPALDTVDWDGPGNLRVSYVLPSRDWTVEGAGVFWPAPDDAEAVLLGEDGLAAGPHRLVWVDLSRQ